MATADPCWHEASHADPRAALRTDNAVPDLWAQLHTRIIQTAEYSAAILTYFIDFLDAPNDLDAALQARMERQKIIYSLR